MAASIRALILITLVALPAGFLVAVSATAGSSGGGSVTTLPTPPPHVPGDADCSGTVDAVDAALILQREAALIGSLPCPENGDVNGDYATNAIDAERLLQYLAGLSSIPPPVLGGIITRNWTWRSEPDGSVRVVGEVASVMAINYFYDLIVGATAYDASGTPLGTASAPTCLSIIHPSGETPFEVVIPGPLVGVDHVGAALTGFLVTDFIVPVPEPPDPPPFGIDLTVSGVTTDGAGRHVMGTVHNRRDDTAYESAKVCAASYDASGLVLDAGSAPAVPDTLGPDETSAFEVVLDVGGAAVADDAVWLDAAFAP